MQSWRGLCLARTGQEFIRQENSLGTCRLSWASFSSLLQTWGCPGITLCGVCECSRPQKENFCSQGDEPCAGCLTTFDNLKTPMVDTGGHSRDRLNANRGREHLLTPQPECRELQEGMDRAEHKHTTLHPKTTHNGGLSAYGAKFGSLWASLAGAAPFAY